MKKVLFYTCLILLYLTTVSHAATYLDPKLVWRTIETPHFYIHFNQGEETSAQKLANIAEDVHDELSSLLRHKVRERVHVVLFDNRDYSNGFAHLIGNPEIKIYLTDYTSNIYKFRYGDWLKHVFVHEYAHILHMDNVAGYTKYLKIFGRVFFPLGLEPRFMLEGMAVYAESKYTQGGRLKEPIWDAMLRADILDNHIKTKAQLGVGLSSWPQGQESYIYGGKFVEYLVDQYGEEKLINANLKYGEEFPFLFFEGAFEKIYHKSFDQLWSNWIEEETQKANIIKDESNSSLQSKIVYSSQGSIFSPVFSPDGENIYFNLATPDIYSGIYQYNLNDKQTTKVIDAQINDSPVIFNPLSQNMLFSQGNIYNNFYYYNDLYSYNPRSKIVLKLTDGARASDLALSPNGEVIIYVKNQPGKRTLVEYNQKKQNHRNILDQTYGVQYSAPNFSPKGEYFVAVKRNINGEQDLYIIDPIDLSEKLLFNYKTQAYEANPRFTADGKYLLFDANQDGIVNIFAYEIASQKTYQVSNVITAAIMPNISPDNKKITYVKYSALGWQLALSEFNPKQWKPVKFVPSKSENKSAAAHGLGKNYPSRGYNFMQTIWPRFWLPYYYESENGNNPAMYLMGWDVLEQHRVNLFAGYDYKATRPSYYFQYINNQYLPQISLYTSDFPAAFSLNSQTYWERQIYRYAYLSFYNYGVYQDWDSQAWSFGLEQNIFSPISDTSQFTTKPSIGQIRGIGLSYRYSNKRQYPMSITYEDGMDIKVSSLFNTNSIGSDFEYNLMSLKLSSYYNILKEHHVLAFNGNLMFIDGNDFPAQGAYSSLSLNQRGYSSSSLSGAKGYLTSLEYFYPIVWIENGWWLGELFFKNIWGNVFFELGGAASSIAKDFSSQKSIGLEVGVNGNAAYDYLDLSFKIGFAKGLDNGGESQFYFNFSYFDLLGIY